MYEDEDAYSGAYKADKELVAGGPSQRNWRGIGIALLVILSICALITIAVITLTPSGKGDKSAREKLNLTDIVFPLVSPFDPSATWLSDHILTYRDKSKNIWSLSLLESDGSTPYTKKKLLEGDIVSRYNKGIVSPDGKYAAMFAVQHKVFRHSNLWRVDVYKISAVSSVRSHLSLNDDRPIKVFHWAPMSYPSAFAFVDASNNMWYQADAFDQSTRIQITSDGSDDIFNGVCDWLYEEEILETDISMYFSTTGTKLVYLSINNTLVKRIDLELYSKDANYPRLVPIPYPKVGETIPTVTLRVYFVNKLAKAGQKGPKVATLKPPEEVLKLREFYFIRGSWLKRNSKDGSETFVAIWSNRVQNVSFYSSCQVPNSLKGDIVQCKLDYYHAYVGNWLTPALTRVAFSTQNRYYTMLPRKWTDGFHYVHLAYISNNASSLVLPKFVTSGAWEITDFVGYDPKDEIAYFIAAYPHPRARHLYSIYVNGAEDEKAVCLTCHMPKNECNHVSATFSPGAHYYTLTCNGPSVPKTYLISTSNTTTKPLEYILTLTSNKNYAKFLANKSLPVVKYEQVELEDGFVAQVKLLLPPAVESAAAGETFPLILRVYSGPGTQLVVDNWALTFETYLVSKHNYIVAYVDGRGSGNRGTKYTNPIYRNMGTVEIKDQIDAIRILENTTTYIRRESIGVWGWSYGGFATAHIIKRDRFKVFKCAAAVAPVTNFLYYDAAYTERFMGLNYSSDNYDGYQRTNVYADVSAFTAGKFMLAHGTGDDNVHFQNSAMLVEALVQKGIQFQFMAYPNQQHSLSDNLLHFYTMLDNFFVNCLQSTKQSADDS